MPKKVTKTTTATELATIAPAESTALVVENDVIDSAVQEINSLYAAGPLQVALAIGEVVAKHFYGGDNNAVRNRDPNKDVSFRKLSEHPNLKVSKSVLHRSVDLYELCTRLGVPGRGQLTVTHLRAVLPLEDKTQEKLINKALEKGWNSSKMEEEAAKARKKEGTQGGGRRPLPNFVKGIRRIGKLAEDTKLFDDLDDEHLSELDEAESLKLYQMVIGMKLKCWELQTRLESRTPGFGRGEVIDVEPDLAEAAPPKETPAKKSPAKKTKTTPKKPSKPKITKLAAEVAKYLAKQDGSVTEEEIMQAVPEIPAGRWEHLENYMTQKGLILRDGDGFRAPGNE